MTQVAIFTAIWVLKDQMAEADTKGDALEGTTNILSTLGGLDQFLKYTKDTEAEVIGFPILARGGCLLLHRCDRVQHRADRRRYPGQGITRPESNETPQLSGEAGSFHLMSMSMSIHAPLPTMVEMVEYAMIDSPAAPALTREQRRLLLTSLDLIPAFDNSVGRDLLLLDLPGGAIRSPIKSVDLGHLVRAAEAWGVLNNGTPALLVLLQNALDLSQGSMSGRILQTLYEMLAAQPAMPPAAAAPMIATGFALLEAARQDPPTPADDAPGAPEPDPPTPGPAPARRVRRPSFEQQIERYIALDQAIAAERWDEAARLAARLKGFRDVDQRLAVIAAGATRCVAARQALGYAYADRDWAAVLQHAPGVCPEVPEDSP